MSINLWLNGDVNLRNIEHGDNLRMNVIRSILDMHTTFFSKFGMDLN